MKKRTISKKSSTKSKSKQKPSRFAEKLKQGLEEILEFEKGKKTLKSRLVEGCVA